MPVNGEKIGAAIEPATIHLSLRVPGIVALVAGLTPVRRPPHHSLLATCHLMIPACDAFVCTSRVLLLFRTAAQVIYADRVRTPFKRGHSMRVRSFFIAAGFFIVAILVAGPSWAQARGQAKTDNTNPRTARFGVWDNSTNPNNVMTYEAYEKDGSKLTVRNPSNPSQDWSYVTLFDGVFRPVQGQEGAETAVEIINPKSIRIYNKRNGALQQVVINTLSDDNNTISNEYIRMDKDGKIMGVTHVTYIRRKK